MNHKDECVCVCACVYPLEGKSERRKGMLLPLSLLRTVSVLCLGTRITTITPTFFNCIFIKPGKHDVKKKKKRKYNKETNLTAIKENIVTTLGCKAQIYMWKKKQATQMFLLFSFFACVTPPDEKIRSEMESSLRLLGASPTASFWICVYVCTAAAAAFLIFATCNSELWWHQ